MKLADILVCYDSEVLSVGAAGGNAHFVTDSKGPGRSFFPQFFPCLLLEPFLSVFADLEGQLVVSYFLESRAFLHFLLFRSGSHHFSQDSVLVLLSSLIVDYGLLNCRPILTVSAALDKVVSEQRARDGGDIHCAIGADMDFRVGQGPSRHKAFRGSFFKGTFPGDPHIPSFYVPPSRPFDPQGFKHP